VGGGGEFEIKFTHFGTTESMQCSVNIDYNYNLIFFTPKLKQLLSNLTIRAMHLPPMLG